MLAILLIAIFFITGADSASIVMGMLSQHGEEEPKRNLVIFWGVAQGAVASVLLWSGGDDLRAGLTALQNLVIIVGGAFMLVIIAMCVSLMKSLRAEPYESTLPSRVRKAVLYVQDKNEESQHAVALTALGAGPRGAQRRQRDDDAVTDWGRLAQCARCPRSPRCRTSTTPRRSGPGSLSTSAT